MDIFLNTNRRRKRFRHNTLIVLACGSLTIVLYIVLFKFYANGKPLFFPISLISGYIAALLLAATLTLGALRIWRKKVNPVSSDLRRDIGIWSAFFSLAHVFFGLNVHMKNWMQYFIDDGGNLRTDLFGITNYLGIIATLIVLTLLLTSNDFSLRYFGRERWKSIQRWNYVFVILVVAHSIIYQIVEQRLTPFLFIIGAVALWIMTMQFVGFQMKRREVKKVVAVQTKPEDSDRYL